MNEKETSQLALMMAKKRYSTAMPFSDNLGTADGVNRAEEVFARIRRATTRKKIARLLEQN